MKRFCLQFFEMLMLSTLISEYKGDIYFDQPVKFGQATYYSGEIYIKTTILNTKTIL